MVHKSGGTADSFEVEGQSKKTGEIPRQMLLTIVVLIPKGNSSKEFRGIGLLEIIWKLLGRVLDLRLSEIELHFSRRSVNPK